MSAEPPTEPIVTATSTPPGEETQANANNNGTEKQVQLAEILKFAKEAMDAVTQINNRAAHREEALTALTSLMTSLCTYSVGCITTIESKIDGIHDGIHAALAKTDVTLAKTEKSWAQIVASGTPSAPSTTKAKARPIIGPEQIKQREQAKREREKYELTLNAKFASQEIRTLLDTEPDKDLKAQFQKAIDEADISAKPKVVSVNKLPKCTIRLQFKTPEQATEARKAPINWDIAYEGVKEHKPIYGIVVHGVRNEAVDLDTDTDHDNIIKELEEENSDRGIKIIKIATLRRTPKHKPTSHRSLKVYTNDKEAANKCIQLGFIIDSTKHKVERYVPQWHLKQCYKCHAMGHLAAECKAKEKCGKCSKEDHITANCTVSAEALHCANCGKAHAAWDAKCQKRIEQSQRLANIRSDPSTTYFP
jgi:hypothetical protein